MDGRRIAENDVQAEIADWTRERKETRWVLGWKETNKSASSDQWAYEKWDKPI